MGVQVAAAVAAVRVMRARIDFMVAADGCGKLNYIDNGVDRWMCLV